MFLRGFEQNISIDDGTLRVVFEFQLEYLLICEWRGPFSSTFPAYVMRYINIKWNAFRTVAVLSCEKVFVFNQHLAFFV